jgi:esterase/lipase
VGIIACHLGIEYKPKKLGLIVTPYQGSSTEDLEGKFQAWKEAGFGDIISSRFGELRIPFSFIQDSQKYNALEVINQLNCPILFVVGHKDTKVPNSVTGKLYDKVNEPKQWDQIGGMEHKYQPQLEMLGKVNELILSLVSK